MCVTFMMFDNSRKSMIVLVVNVNGSVVTVQNNVKCIFFLFY